VALVGGKAQTSERLGDAALLALLPHEQQHPRSPSLVVDIPLPGGRGGGSGALAFPVEQRRPEGQIAVAGGGGEEGFSLPEGDEQQVAPAGFVPEHALAVDPGGVIGEHTERRFDFGAAVMAVHAQRHRQRPGQGMEAVIDAVGQEQQLAQFR
jgi:hypothetical protein